MRKLIFLLCLSLSITGFAQIADPVKWAFTAKQLHAGVYEIHLTATIAAGWHIYSQTTPDGGPLPTIITFSKNPLITLDGKVVEKGKLEQKHEKIFKVDVKQYSGKVDFVQVVKINGKAKTMVAGEIESMSCDDHQCLPPKSVKFSVQLK